MSGGRATVSRGEVRQAGDITAVSAEGHRLTDKYFIECKHVRHLALGAFVVSGIGPLALYWRKARIEAAKHGRKPMLIAKQNHMPIIVLLLEKRHTFGSTTPLAACYKGGGVLYLFDELFKVRAYDQVEAHPGGRPWRPHRAAQLRGVADVHASRPQRQLARKPEQPKPRQRASYV